MGKGRWESEGDEMRGSEEDRRRFKTVDGRMIVVGAYETVRETFNRRLIVCVVVAQRCSCEYGDEGVVSFDLSLARRKKREKTAASKKQNKKMKTFFLSRHLRFFC